MRLWGGVLVESELHSELYSNTTQPIPGKLEVLHIYTDIIQFFSKQDDDAGWERSLSAKICNLGAVEAPWVFSPVEYVPVGCPKRANSA
jgi:hypothetical protein